MQPSIKWLTDKYWSTDQRLGTPCVQHFDQQCFKCFIDEVERF